MTAQRQRSSINVVDSWPSAGRVRYLKSRTPAPQAAFPPLRRGWTGSPHRGTPSPPLDRTSGGWCHPRQRSQISRCCATIEPGTPIVRDGRDNYVQAGCGLSVPPPPMWGPGRSSPPHPRRQHQTSSHPQSIITHTHSHTLTHNAGEKVPGSSATHTREADNGAGGQRKKGKPRCLSMRHHYERPPRPQRRSPTWGKSLWV